MAAPDVAPPLRVGPYELVERIGAGGMAEVYVGRRAGPHGFSKRFAIKRILPQLARDPHFVSMFCDEARVCAALAHPNIVQVVDFGEHDGELFMAMEYVDGLSCARLLRAVASRGERVPVGVALFIAHEVLRALAYAHEARDEAGRSLGIVHRDVSPGNVLIGRAGEVKLTDFGIVRGEFIDRRTSPGELKGKIGYMSPEQAVGEDVDYRSDLFTTAIILAELLIARPLFPGRDEVEILSRIHAADLTVLRRHAATIRPDLLRLLIRALAKKPEDRFGSAAEMADAVRAVARAAGTPMTGAELAPWLGSLGLLPASGMRRAVAVSKTAPTLPARPVVALLERVAPSKVTPRYELVQPEGRVAGRLGAPALVEMAVTGRLPGDTRVSVDGSEPVPAAELPELARFYRGSIYAFGTLPAVARTQPVGRRELPALLYRVALERRSGLLVVRSGRREKRVAFSAGSPVLVASTAREELLGRRLLARGVLSTRDLDAALERAAERGVRLGSVLVERQLVRPAALLRDLGEQLEDRFIDLGDFRDGELSFSADAELPAEHLPPLRRPAALVTRLIRARYDDTEIVRLLGRALDEPVALAPVPVGTVDQLGLEPAEERVIALCRGARSLGELVTTLARAGRIPAGTARRALFIALTAGVLASPSA